MNDGLKDKHRKAIFDILTANPRVERVVLFGSRAMGTFTTTSDVDLALFGDELTLTDQARLAAAIDKLPMAQQVDLLIYKSIDNDKLKQHIKKHGKEWFRRGWVMSADWPLVELSELVKDLTVGFVGSMTQEYVEKGVPFFRSKNIKPYDLEWADIKYVSRQFHEKLKKSSLAPGDVVIVRTGTPGTACVIPESVEEANCSDVVIARVNDKKLSAYYLSYFMNSVAVHQVSSHLVCAVQQHFNIGSAKKIKIPLPSRDEQEEIVTVLKTLDDKLKLNRQINQTLEEMAQAIFKSWFVDFEPVKAKIKAKVSGQNPERAAMCAISGKTAAELDQLPPDQFAQLRATAALFSDELTDSELGLIPKGWEVKSISDISKFASGKIDVSALGIENYISTENMLENRRGVSFASSLPSVSTVPSFSKGQVLISNIRPYFKKIWIASFDGGRSNDVLAFDSTEKNCTEFLYNLLYQDTFFDFMMRTSKGAKMPRGDKNAITGWKFADSGYVLRSFFSANVRPYYSYIESLNAEVQQLSLTRDTLLPKLLSGEISVGSAQSTIDEAV
ncbi:restriction endonuclease subunit S [Desulfobacter sp.]|uniref:restriction endonuclease subunit S n=1 Tax=Desulfobacter sp. TaxID=2294 RepID=UPI00257E0168|nr:restriction endonuclease subunit S [Desulfobacter sp.]